MLPTRPDDRDKIQIGDFVRLCNCEEHDDEICLKIHPRGIYLGYVDKSLKFQTDIFDYWTIFEKGALRFYLYVYPIRIINEGRGSSKK